jgi:hypothetical protein
MNTPRAWRALSLPLLLVIGACSTGNSLPAADASTAFRAAPAHSVRFVYQTLVDPSLGATYCLGIDNRGTIAGFVRDRGVKGVRIIAPYQANDFQLYTARTVFLGFRGDQGTYGFHIGPGDLVTGFTRRNGLRTIYREDKSNDTEVTGIFSDNGVVGFYVNKLGADVAFRLIGRKIAYLSPPSSVSAAATGVNRFGDIVGWTQSSGGSTSGVAQTRTLRKSAVSAIHRHTGFRNQRPRRRCRRLYGAKRIDSRIYRRQSLPCPGLAVDRQPARGKRCNNRYNRHQQRTHDRRLVRRSSRAHRWVYRGAVRVNGVPGPCDPTCPSPPRRRRFR